MSVQSKYKAVLDLGLEIGTKNGSVKEENGVLKVYGEVATPYEKNLIWDKIKEVGGSNPTDIIADIRPATDAYFAKYTVKKGDTLGAVAKHFYGEAKKYNQIFEANRHILSNANEIEIGQELTIPHEN